MYIDNFFKTFSSHIKFEPTAILDLLTNIDFLKRVFLQLDSTLTNNYLYDNFIFWLSAYACKEKQTLISFFLEKNNLDFICIDFIEFCFAKKIAMNVEETLNSFCLHNKLSDDRVKQELKKIPEQETISLLGFGLDEGTYEKGLAQFLIDEGLCQNVILYGLDPYAKKGNNIHYLTLQELNSKKEFNFDVIIARWSLHHVAFTSRWHDLSQCINRCNANATVLFIEHGMLHEKLPLIKENFYGLLNATFDIIANIGLRPDYFTQTKPKGTNFFIRYLKAEDYNTIINGTSKLALSQVIYDVGPYFPNQTICKFFTK